jgi:hypothetical protein
MSQQLKIILLSVFALFAVVILLLELGVFGQSNRISNFFTRKTTVSQGYESCKIGGVITFTIPRTCEKDGVKSIENFDSSNKESYITSVEDEAAQNGQTIFTPEVSTGLDRVLYPGEKFSTSSTFLLKDVKYTKVVDSSIKSMEVSHSVITDKNSTIKAALSSNILSFNQSSKNPIIIPLSTKSENSAITTTSSYVGIDLGGNDYVYFSGKMRNNILLFYTPVPNNKISDIKTSCISSIDNKSADVESLIKKCIQEKVAADKDLLTSLNQQTLNLVKSF